MVFSCRPLILNIGELQLPPKKIPVIKWQDIVTHLYQQLSAEGVVVVIREDLRQLTESAETLPVRTQRSGDEQSLSDSLYLY